MRHLIMLLSVLCSCSPADTLEAGLPIRVECRITVDDRERLDCLYALQDCERECGARFSFTQFPTTCLCD